MTRWRPVAEGFLGEKDRACGLVSVSLKFTAVLQTESQEQASSTCLLDTDICNSGVLVGWLMWMGYREGQIEKTTSRWFQFYRDSTLWRWWTWAIQPSGWQSAFRKQEPARHISPAWLWAQDVFQWMSVFFPMKVFFQFLMVKKKIKEYFLTMWKSHKTF